MYALDAETGKPIWRTNTTKVKPFGRGGFYSSPAIDFGRVYAARDDGTVYAFDEKTGKVEWYFPTHNFIYGSPALAEVPGTPPTVYIGSYDEHLYALNALNGKQRWKYDVGGPIPGTSTVIGNTVYTTSFKTREAVGIDVHTHRKTFEPRPGRLHADRLRRPAPVSDRLLRAGRAGTEAAGLLTRCRRSARRAQPAVRGQRPRPASRRSASGSRPGR